MRKTQEPWKFDPAIERVKARMRFAVAIALVALIGALLLGDTLHALYAPLVSIVEHMGVKP